ncbi:MAG: hypothetical protein ABIR08_05490 [Sphingomonas sp.]
MKTWLMAGIALVALSGCSGGSDAVGENSAGSIKTTAVGEVVANIAAPTPTPTAEATDIATNSANVATDATADAVDNATTTH